MQSTTSTEERMSQKPQGAAWIWASPVQVFPEPPYAVMRWKGGTLYAGPADSALNFPPTLVDGASLLICTRAEALRHAMDGKMEAP